MAMHREKIHHEKNVEISLIFNGLSTFFKIHRSPGYAQTAKTDHRFPSNRSGLASGAVSPGPSLSIKTDRLWHLALHIDSGGSEVIRRRFERHDCE